MDQGVAAFKYFGVKFRYKGKHEEMINRQNTKPAQRTQL